MPYLLDVNEERGTLATFDQRIRPSLIGENSGEHLEYIPV